MKKQIWLPLVFVLCCWIGSCQEPIESEIPTLSSLVVKNPFFSLLEAAAIKGEVAIPLSDTNPNDEGGNFTLFAPTNQAFERLGLIQNRDLIGIRKGFLSLILNFHVANGILEGRQIPETASLPSLVGPVKKIITRDQQHYINGSRILFTDVKTKNGIFHGIDKLLLVSETNTWLTAKSFAHGEIFKKPDLQLLEAAVIHAGLETFVAETQNYTLFAPNDQAFAAIGIHSPEDILNLSPGLVADILANHVVMDGGRFTSEKTQDTLTSLHGSQLELGPYVNGQFSIMSNSSNGQANMVIPDIQTSNAVVHIIDQVLVP